MKYSVSLNGEKVEINLNCSISSKLVLDDKSQQKVVHKVTIGEDFTIGDISLKPLNSENFPALEKMMEIPNSPGIGRKKDLWVPRGDAEEPSRCFIAFKGGEPLGYFNIGNSVINFDYKGTSISPNECGAFKGGLDKADFAKVIYASTCYYDVVKKLNPSIFSSHVIYTTKDQNMHDALLAAGWHEHSEGDEFFNAITTTTKPEKDDGRPPRFTRSEGGKFYERDFAGGSYYCVEKTLLVYEMGSNTANIEILSE